MMFCMYRGNIKLAICFCGIVRIHVPIVFSRIAQYQTRDLLLLDGPNLCSIAFYVYRGNIKLAICFCGIARMHVVYCVLHGSGQRRSSDSLLRDRPN